VTESGPQTKTSCYSSRHNPLHSTWALMVIGASGYQPIRSPHVLTHTNILFWISLEILIQPLLLIFQLHAISPHILPGERALSLRRVILAWARLETENNPQSGRILAQAKLSRLNESDSRSSETGSPRRDLAQKQGMSF